LDKFEIPLIKNKNNLKIYKISPFYPVKKNKIPSNNTKIASRPPFFKTYKNSPRLLQKSPQVWEFFVFFLLFVG
jgi:hypothetical protein